MTETPSGKGAADENFPVGSLLLPRALRPHVATYYAFARAIDDIADNPALAPADKLARLDGFAAAIRGETDDPAYAKAHAMRRSLALTGVPARHCLDLVSAFRQDAVKTRYESWDELIDYCDRSASPVGRYLLDLHGEDRAQYRHSDALCNALQVINHLQDCADDHAALDRVYLPQAWLREAGATVDELARPAASPALRRVLDRCVAGTLELLDEARRLPGALRSRRLALESAVIVRLAERLAARLSREDPLARRVALGRPEALACTVRGVIDGLIGRPA
jgi:squalene synthase HpnC